MEQKKNKPSLIPFEQRCELIRSLRFVDDVFVEESIDKTDDIKQFNADVIVWGSDYKGQFDVFNELCQVVYLDRTEGISTTAIKSSLKQFFTIPKDDVLKALEVLEQLYKQLGDAR